MKKLFFTLLFLLPFFCNAREVLHLDTVLLNKYSGNSLIENWKFTAQYIPGKEPIDLSSWKPLSTLSGEDLNDTLHKLGFTGIGWFAKEFYIDSGLTNKPLAFSFNGYGAFDIYLDGKLIHTFGTFKSVTTKAKYVNPKLEPVIFSLAQPGRHVLMLHLENYFVITPGANSLASDFSVAINVKYADAAVELYANGLYISFTIMYGVLILFLALAFVHFMFYLFYRKSSANLNFGLFNLSMSVMFGCIFALSNIKFEWVHTIALFAMLIALFTACLSLHAFVNSLYYRKKWGFILITVLGVLLFLSSFYNNDIVGQSLFIFLVIFTAIDAVIKIIIAMRKKIPGSHILGCGILFFFFSIAGLFLYGFLTSGHFEVTPATLQGILLIMLLILILFSIPFSISAYLAWEFAYLNKSLSKQLQQVDRLSQKTIAQEKEKQEILANQNEVLEQEVKLRTEEIIAEKKKSDDLLLNILPAEVANELKEKGEAEAKLFDHVTVLFTDFVNFTQMSERMNPQQLVAQLHENFKAFDEIMERNGLEKIKTIGDAYLAVSGMPVANDKHAYNAVKAGLEIAAYIRNQQYENRFEVRVGIHSGPLVAGIVGVKKFAYDIWGDTVNTASRMESSSEAGKINISESTYRLVKDDFTFIHRGKIDAKHKGAIDMYFVEGEVRSI
ncbi:hypothetical protein F0919_09410 [Taibaiella lutea]|uniref:Guanylate cyclase domain-containing protein n=1 Tax=Taibaiella lutea TaxID=2608001 RepID=A0A5M6CNF1_9BACT|nr:adenylate/guanylate cyclase domain-containing protein [Taibaiella lutea]KAA5534815.1 hypothetical protein F0919_09410 [Taibaiella lutea]